ncbi:DoxX family protein [Flavivirga rizhaonensis]|uniref:DoxX family protein n=1 Tax=Flavivirga rizhaonensis TaxID=2559571 RepID=A0A4S1DSK7_9FLAO|nr:DoxX family protein [Flavivirga rizhaonensis]TGV00368.1 DoxX family protein [Flavivirga rizhaonensis]
MNQNIIKLFLRLAVSVGFLSAVADRFGFWQQNVSVWGNWQSFLDYTQLINPYIPKSLIPFLGVMATATETLFALCLLIGFKTETFAKLSGFLLLIFALAMCFSTGIKDVFDYSVLSASAAAFALSSMKEKHFEIDIFFNKISL